MTATTTFHLFSLKNLSFVGVFVASLEFIGFEPGILGLLAFVMLIDVITGIHRVYRNDGATAIASHPLLKGIGAKLMLMLVLLSVGATATIIGYEAAPYIQAAISVIALAELYSVVGNVYSARTGKPKVEFDAVAFILVKIRDLLDKYIK